ncbi:hypothetical protein PLEOSDRAFT_1109490 [Pleurotus ostreatus PC15]|uniref:J domain-containing protein n=1 Tax=Pleurotus ostreatus (strain PC15) TaxID=1137138 RepID=A0A067N609_PLEO1|nr:hypothetical protein PLEOSDRAFT_1109490 [Pleurotus ostreatus PC15]
MSIGDDLNANDASKGPDYLYSVLNVPKWATQAEIKERHRSLSLIFHPDKQHDEKAKDVASRKFLEIQKAYEVLSDPFTREVYNVLGEEGLSLKWPPYLRDKDTEELRSILKQTKYEQKQQKLENLIRPKGQFTCSLDAISLFSSDATLPEDPWHVRCRDRLNDLRIAGVFLRHSIHKEITSQTTISANASVQTRPTSASFTGTVRHQFSPRLTFEATSPLLRLRSPRIRGIYKDGENAVTVSTVLTPAWFLGSPPPVNVTLGRRLFPDSMAEGSIALNLGSPALNISVFSPTPFDNTLDSQIPPQYMDEESSSQVMSISGLSRGVRYWSAGLVLDGNPRLKGECGVRFAELGMQLKGGVECGFHGPAWFLGGNWSSETVEIDSTLNAGPQGVMYKLDLGYIEQRFSFPIILSAEYDATLALWCAVIPSLAGLLSYHFVVKPKRRAQRLSYIRATRQALRGEHSSLLRDTEVSSALLKDIAKKHMDAEASVGGLIIQEALYGLFDVDGDDLSIDVTVALQALVHHSQLYVPGDQTKLGIQGFCDPAPFAPKILRIRYQFRGFGHYAEIPDSVPIVLPQADHRVD